MKCLLPWHFQCDGLPGIDLLLAMFHVKQLSVLGPVAGWSTESKVQVRHVSRETSNQSTGLLSCSFVRQLARRHVSLADGALRSDVSRETLALIEGEVGQPMRGGLPMHWRLLDRNPRIGRVGNPSYVTHASHVSRETSGGHVASARVGETSGDGSLVPAQARMSLMNGIGHCNWRCSLACFT